jgi:hypothetical protein
MAMKRATTARLDEIRDALRQAYRDAEYLRLHHDEFAGAHDGEWVGVNDGEAIFASTFDSLLDRARARHWDPRRVTVRHLLLQRSPRIL